MEQKKPKKSDPQFIIGGRAYNCSKINEIKNSVKMSPEKAQTTNAMTGTTLHSSVPAGSIAHASSNIQTHTEQLHAAETKVKNSTDAYTSTKAVSSVKTDISGIQNSSPQSVGKIKTDIRASEGSSHYNSIQTVKAGHSSGNMQTHTEQLHAAEAKVKSAIDAHTSSNVRSSLKTEISGMHSSTSQNTGRIKTDINAFKGTAHSSVPIKYLSSNVQTYTEKFSDAAANVEKTTEMYSSTRAVSSVSREIVSRQLNIPTIVQNIRTIADTSRSRRYTSNGSLPPLSLSSDLNKVRLKIQNSLSKADDTASQTAGGAIKAGYIAYKSFRIAQQASPVVIKAVPAVIRAVPTGVKHTVNGIRTAGDVTLTAGRAAVTVAKTALIMQNSSFVPFSSRFTKETLNMLSAQAKATRLPDTLTSKKIVHSVKQIKTKAESVKKGIISTTKTVKTTVKSTVNVTARTFRIARGVITGNAMYTAIARKNLIKARDAALKSGVNGLKIVGRASVRGAFAGGKWVIKNVPKQAVKISCKLGGGIACGTLGIMASSDDMTLQGINRLVNNAKTAAKVARYTVKTGEMGIKAAGHTVRTSVKVTAKVTKGTYSAVRYLRQKGWRAAWAKAKSNAAKGMAQAGKSVVSLVINIAKLAGKKVVVPIILIAAIAMIMTSLLSTPVTAVSGVFGGIFEWKKGEKKKETVNVSEYVSNHMIGKRSQYINDLDDYLCNSLKSGGGEYDYVRIKTNNSDELMQPTLYDLIREFYTIDELTNIVQPIFNAVMLQKYDLAPTEKQAEKKLDEIFEDLLQTEETAATEYCGQSSKNGVGEVQTHSCGHVHALYDCPNKQTGKHDPDSFACSECCHEYYICGGYQGEQTCGYPEENHTHSISNGCYHCTKEEHTHYPQWTGNSYAFYLALQNILANDGTGREMNTLQVGDVVGNCWRVESINEYGGKTWGEVDEEHTHGDGYCNYELNCSIPEHTHSPWNSPSDPGCYETKYCNGHEKIYYDCHHNAERHSECSGYSYCGGHRVLTVNLTMNGVYELLNKYFEEPINKLKGKSSLDDDEKQELSTLEDTYEICLEYIKQMSSGEYGNITKSDLEKVKWVKSDTRKENQPVIDTAMSQLGNVGGETYWKWYGYSTRKEWAACFVSWCMNQNGHSEVRFSDCCNGVKYFKNNSLWKDAGFGDVVAGDVIFLDMDSNEEDASKSAEERAQQVGLVIGRDENDVYVIEGNSGDVCRMKKYSLNSDVIVGYGLIHF